MCCLFVWDGVFAMLCGETKIYGRLSISIACSHVPIPSLPVFPNTGRVMVSIYLCVHIDCDSRAKYFNPANIYKSYQCNTLYEEKSSGCAQQTICSYFPESNYVWLDFTHTHVYVTYSRAKWDCMMLIQTRTGHSTRSHIHLVSG